MEHELKNIQRLREHLAECTVLLKGNGAYPLEAPGTVAAYGNGIRGTVKGGTGSGDVYSRYFVTVEQGLKEAGFTLYDEEWLGSYDALKEAHRDGIIKAAIDKAAAEGSNLLMAALSVPVPEPEYDLPLKTGADSALYVVSRISGEGKDRKAGKGDFELTDTEIRDILLLDKEYDRFMLVINAGGPIDLSPVMGVSNILVLSQLGVETGKVLADIMLGKAYPSGKLSTSWAGASDYCSEGSFGDMDDTFYREGIYVGYRYFDAAGRKPLFPFGYGLGYTKFEIRFAGGIIEKSSVTAEFEVSNIGEHPGREVVQLYLSCPQGKLNRERKSLAGYAKTKELRPGESQKLSIGFDLKDFAGYDGESASYILEKGTYVILVGNSSEDAKPVMKGILGGSLTVRKVKKLFPDPGFEDWRPEVMPSYDTDGLPCFAIDMSGFETETVDYGSSGATDPRTDDLSASELAYMNVGFFGGASRELNIIGNAADSVAGAAGETFGIGSKGIDRLIMADGPAGLRLSKQYYKDETGVHAVGTAFPDYVMRLLPREVSEPLALRFKVKEGVEIKEQYATALPIGTAIAQSWNEDLARLCGEIAGEEAKVFGVDLWLAPALNIHRNVLCGRNFEYYSEDPVLSGNMAAAVTVGAQKTGSVGATIKHLAFNNQETNRYNNNSVISERALREIYLKGFEIAVRKGDPAAVMSSYNLVNGEHTSESKALIKDILFSEFGYRGLVMTDWIILGPSVLAFAHYPVPVPWKIAASGHSLLMPGTQKDYDDIMEALSLGRLSLRQLKENASRLLWLIDRLHRK